MTHPLTYEPLRESANPHGLGIVSCGFGGAGAFLLGYGLWRLFGDKSVIYFGVCLLGLFPTALGLVLALAAFFTSRRRCAFSGLLINLAVDAGLLLVLLLGPGPE